MTRAIQILLFISLNISCVTSTESDINLNKAATDDESYSVALEKWTKNRTVINNFETRFRLTATYLSPEFRGAFAKRFKEIYLNDDMKLSEADKKAGFFVVPKVIE